MLGLKELQAANDRAAERELADMRADTIRYLRYTVERDGIDGVHALFNEAIPSMPVAVDVARAKGGREAA